MRGADTEGSQPLVSVVIPCLNEIPAVADCVRCAHEALARAALPGEVIVVDNGSTDGSARAAGRAGALVLHEPRRGYGRACLRGFAAARGRYIVMGDGDGSYDFGEIGRFVTELESGADFVTGTRLRGRIQPGAMSWLHRYVGTPLLTWLLNALFGTRVSDGQCGLRAFRRDLLPRLDLRASGMELASEQLTRSAQLDLRIVEVPIEYRPRAAGTSKLSPVWDGLRHLRLLVRQGLTST